MNVMMRKKDEVTSASVQIEAKNLFKSFRRRDGTIVHALDDVSLSVFRGELVVLLGPSGCGKTTLLRAIAGLETPSKGEISLGDEVVYSSSGGVFIPPEHRSGVGFMFQSYALWPHMTAFENIAYPLRTMRLAGDEITRRVEDMLGMLSISELAQQYPGDMSGGQQQRVALARALVNSDRAILFDEPLSNVDARVRQQVRVELAALQRRINFSGIYVTHDQSEAMAIADRVAVMHGGRIIQFGTPQEIFIAPQTRFVAKFTGPLNEFQGKILERKQKKMIVKSPYGETPLAVDGESVADNPWICFRPHTCRLNVRDTGKPNTFEASVIAVLYMGTHSEYVLETNGRQITAVGNYSFATEGSTVHVTVPTEEILIYDFDALEGSYE
jgi:iron(III) transport system ATP-binding protein